MKQGTIVETINTKKQGVVVADNFGCCGSDEIPVVFFGTDYFSGTNKNDLKEVGVYEVTPDPHKCGQGQGAKCCKYLTLSADGFCCERFGSLRDTLIFKTGMKARRNPVQPFPECMIF